MTILSVRIPWFTPLFAAAAAVLLLTACGPAEPEVDGTPPDIRRLTEQQYRNIIADVFGSAIVVGGRFDTPVRTEGLLAVGARNATVTAGSMRQYDEMARAIASQVLSDPHRRFLLPCDLAEDMAFDEACAKAVVTGFGRLLFRRPLTDDEMALRLDLMRGATDRLGQFEDGLHMGLTSLLVAPQFLFVSEDVEPDPDSNGGVRLTSYAIASRLSFLLWDTAPDNVLLAAAESGALHTDSGLEDQVDRMMASPRLETGIRAFFGDMLEFSAFEFLEKDSVIYPAFGIAAAQDAEEQTLRTITHHVIDADADYRDLFTTRKTFMTHALGLVYRVQVNAQKGTWQPYEFPPGDPRAGIQNQIAFLAMNSHPGRSSPTLRGKAIRNMLLCQQVPDPPPDVDFSEFNDPNSPNKTARQRLSAHSTSPACAGCHRITDPIGLALETFDGAGQFRTTENGEPLDTSGNLDGIDFTDAKGLGAALRDNPATTTCVVNRLYGYASGHTLSPRDPWMTYLEERFAENGYRIKPFLRLIATSDAFYAVTEPNADPEAETATLAAVH